MIQRRSEAGIDRVAKQRCALVGCAGSPRAREAAGTIARVDPAIGEPVAKRMSNRGARARQERAKDPSVALAYIEETIARLCDVLGPRVPGDRR